MTDTTPTFSGTAGSALGDSTTVTVNVYQGDGRVGDTGADPEHRASARRQLLDRRDARADLGHPVHGAGDSVGSRRQRRHQRGGDVPGERRHPAARVGRHRRGRRHGLVRQRRRRSDGGPARGHAVRRRVHARRQRVPERIGRGLRELLRPDAGAASRTRTKPAVGRPRRTRRPARRDTSTTSAPPPATRRRATTATTSARGTSSSSTRSASRSAAAATGAPRRSSWLRRRPRRAPERLHARVLPRAALQLRQEPRQQPADGARSGRLSTTTAPTS